MSAVVIEESVKIPAWVVDLRSFRRWARSEEYPRKGRFAFLAGEVWVDMSPEDLYAHNQVKFEVYRALGALLMSAASPAGRFFPDRTLFSNLKAGFSTEPDGIFVSWDSLKSGRVRRVKGTEGYLELLGSPDMVLEVVSPSSVRKDTIVLLRRYFTAGVREYWLIDVRGGRLEFQVLRRGRTGYRPARRRAGWQDSAVFGRSFKLSRGKDPLGDPLFKLAVR